MDVSQTVAEAVAAATQQQQAAAQQAQQLISQPSPPVQNSSSTIDNLTCQWQGCGERCDSAELLYVSVHAILLDAPKDCFRLDATC
jgi:heterodisulfide reductase subunit A-like polyferredoxin